jgi:hypothetical protein
VTDPTHSLKVYNRAGDVVAHTLVDADVYERFKDSRPYLAQGYVRLRLKDEQRTDQFHRIVLGRRCNLRLVPERWNFANTKSRGGTSEYRGVCWCAYRKRWKAHATVGRRKHIVGWFDDEHEAARAVSEWRRLHMPGAIEVAA